MGVCMAQAVCNAGKPDRAARMLMEARHSAEAVEVAALHGLDLGRLRLDDNLPSSRTGSAWDHCSQGSPEAEAAADACLRVKLISQSLWCHASMLEPSADPTAHTLSLWQQTGHALQIFSPDAPARSCMHAGRGPNSSSGGAGRPGLLAQAAAGGLGPRPGEGAG